ncbi:MAG: PDZ domain-containing protein, partial [Eubacterium sp.]|nr:PDZ domain-containing protein [Eubacterium sp.]
SVTSGYVSALNRQLTMSDGSSTYNSMGLIQTDAAINPGNSGGALINMNGELIGINEAKSSTTSDGTTVDNMGFAIPITKALPILQDLMNQETKEVVAEENRGYLGISGADVTSEYSQMYNMPEGLYITAVGDGSPAANAGLQKGDIVVSFDGQSVSTVTELQNLMQYYAAGDTVDIVIDRAGSDGQYAEQTVTVTLGTK